MAISKVKVIPYYTAKDIMNITGVGKNRAYELIRQLNEEMVAQGYIVPKVGRVAKSYADKRLGIGVL